jgi:dienelactone hydrolase
MNTPVASTHMIVLPGGGYAAHAPHEAEPVASWLSEIGVQASVFRYPLNVRHPAPLVTPQSSPFFIWHTAEDAYVPPEHTYRLASALAASGVPHAVHVFAHGPHSLGLAQGAGQAAIWTTLANAWIHEQASPLGQTAGRYPRLR